MFHFLLLLFEFSFLFIAVPLLIYYRFIPNLPIPCLILGALVAFLLPHQDPSFNTALLFSWTGILLRLVPLLLLNALFLALLGLAVRLFAPGFLFSFVRNAPLLWCVVMLFYPLLSVFPQELLYRALFFHRYQPIFGSGWGMILTSAFAFGFVHIIFRNGFAVALPFIGGFLFSLTYYHSGSLLLTCIDHALFGDFIFTIGLGQFFYHGSRAHPHLSPFPIDGA
jgi:uncharacterized protein